MLVIRCCGQFGASGLTVQRFGASVDDKRCAVFYWAPTRETDGEIEREIGITRATDRASAIHHHGSSELAAIKRWARADMAGHFDEVMHSPHPPPHRRTPTISIFLTLKLAPTCGGTPSVRVRGELVGKVENEPCRIAM